MHNTGTVQVDSSGGQLNRENEDKKL